MIPKKLWTYWEGYKPPYIQYCLETIWKRSGVEVNILDKQNISKYNLDTVINPRWKQLEWLAQKTDVMRLGLLYKYGGFWCDADTIMLRNISEIFDKNEDCLCMKWPHGKILNGYIFAQQGSKFIKKCLDLVNQILERQFKPSYHNFGGVYLGECILTKAAEMVQKPMFLSKDMFIPVDFTVHKGIFFKDVQIEQYLNNNYAIALNNSQISTIIKDKTIDYLAEQKNLMGSIIRYSRKLN